MSGEANIVGAKSGEMTVTVGCSPSKVSTAPPPWMLEVAVVVQVVTLGDAGAVAVKVNVTLCPGSIGALPLVPLRLIVDSGNV